MSRRLAQAPRPSKEVVSVSSSTSVPEERWQALFDTPPPSRLTSLVAQMVAWQEQMLAHGDVAPHIGRDLNVAAANAVRRRGTAAESTATAAPDLALPASQPVRAKDDQAPVAPHRSAARQPTRHAGATPPLPPASSQLLPGARLVKAHAGRNHVVEVEAAGFRYEGVLFGSLSAVAKHITGTHWNGLLFFGLRKRGAYPAKARRHG